jgi:hypothetical protein
MASLDDFDGARIERLRRRGLPWMAVARTLGADEKLVRKVHKRWLRTRAASDSEPSPRKSVGRPRREDLDPLWIDAMLLRGLSWREVAKAVKAGTGTVIRIHKAWLAKLARQKKGQKASASKPPAPPKKSRGRHET